MGEVESIEGNLDMSKNFKSITQRVNSAKGSKGGRFRKLHGDRTELM